MLTITLNRTIFIAITSPFRKEIQHEVARLDIPELKLSFNKELEEHFENLYKDYTLEENHTKSYFNFLRFYQKNNSWKNAELEYDGKSYKIKIKSHGKTPSNHKERDFISLSIKLKDNHISIKSTKLDFDELVVYKEPDSLYASSPDEHEQGFNIYEVPFPNLKIDVAINDLNYHRYKIKNFEGSLRIKPNHYIYVDTLSLDAAGGNIRMSGYFNGSNPKLIYFSPKMRLTTVNLDELLLKFENFGQDYLVSENLHGSLSGDIWGKIHLHKDMVPIIDDSEIHLDFNVLSGKLENFGPMEYLADYFADKNVAKVLFDTLQNHIDIKDGVLNIPNMRINTSLGFVEMSGIQNSDYTYEYYLKVPWKMVTKAGASKLFGKKNGEAINPEEEDQIVYAQEGKKIRYVNIQIIGDLEDYQIKLKKAK